MVQIFYSETAPLRLCTNLLHYDKTETLIFNQKTQKQQVIFVYPKLGPGSPY